jgi:cobalt-zinc-cadmium efflux system protein
VSRVARLYTVLALNLVLVAGLVVVGLQAHSLGVIAEGTDYVADALAIVITLVAIRLDRTRYPKAINLAALINAGWLLMLCGLVAAAAMYRLVTGSIEVHGVPVLIASGIAAVVMFIGALILGGDIDDDAGDGDLHVRAVLLDTAGDAAAAGGVALSGAIIAWHDGWYWLDPVVALVIAVVVGFHAIRLLREVGSALRAPTPDHWNR